jgi:hypothetical protein
MLSARSGAGITVKSAADSHAAPPGVRGSTGHVAGTAPDQALAGPAARMATTDGRGVRPKSGSVGSPWTGNPYLPPATTTGKVFFTTHNGENWECSGSTVHSNGKDSVITAGHCVYGSLGGEVPGEGWRTNWIFVPDYSNGYAPYGVWTAKELWGAHQLRQQPGRGRRHGRRRHQHQRLRPAHRQRGRRAGLCLELAVQRVRVRLRLPGGGAFNGQTLQYCNGSEFNWADVSSTMGPPCNFTDGSSGGPWLMSFNGEFGYIDGVNDFIYSSLPGYIFSAYFGNNAESLYDAMANL